MSADSISAWAGVVTAVIAAVGAWYAWKEYRWNQKQHKRELAWKFLARLREETPLKLCTVFMDWKERKIEVPENYRVFFKPDDTFIHTFEKMYDALNRQRLQATPDCALRFSWQEVIYRDCFDQLFDYLTEVHSALQAGWLEASDLKPLRYWIVQLNEAHQKILKTFCEDYYPYAVDAIGDIDRWLKPQNEPLITEKVVVSRA